MPAPNYAFTPMAPMMLSLPDIKERLEEALSHVGLALALTDTAERARHRQQGEAMFRTLGARPWGYDSMIAAASANEAEITVMA